MSFSAGPIHEALEATRNPLLKSWIESANDRLSDFPIQNLPFGIFTDEINPLPRAGVAIGDWILDLAVVHRAGLIEGEAVFAQRTLNAFIALGRDVWRHVRVQVSALLAAGCDTLKNDAALRSRALVPRASATLHLPVDIPGYTDFYSSKEHATNVGSMFRDPKNALLPN
jgi:fumarylacetoacetase